jgi:hypothetical protein
MGEIMTNNDDIHTAMKAVQARPWSVTNHRQRGPAPSMKRLSINMPADLTVTIKEALALIEQPPLASEDREMNELIRRTLGSWEPLHDRMVAIQSPPSYRKSDTGGRKRTTGALGAFIRHCFGNYAQWRGVQSES